MIHFLQGYEDRHDGRPPIPSGAKAASDRLQEYVGRKTGDARQTKEEMKSEARDYYGHTKDEAKETSDRLFGWGQRKVDEGKEEARRAEEQGERVSSRCLGSNLLHIRQHCTTEREL